MIILGWILMIIWFVGGISALAWFFDWGTNPTRSILWVGPFIGILFLWAAVLVIGGANAIGVL